MKLFAVIPALLILVSLCGSPVPPPPGTVTGVVFWDANRNGIHDACDSPLSGIRVVAANASGKTASADTDAGGVFNVDAPAGDDTVALDAAPESIWPITTLQAGQTLSVHVDSGKVTGGLEIGSASRTVYQRDVPSISGVIFDDANGNGVVDVNECPLDRAAIDVNAIQVGSSKAIIDPDGYYQASNFAGPPSANLTYSRGGSMEIVNGRVVDTSNDFVPTGGTYSETNGCATTFSGTARYGPNTYEANIGFASLQSLGTGTIIGTVFNDANGDGVRQASEAGISNVQLDFELEKQTCGLGASAQLVTDAGGGFLAGSLAAGEYKVTAPATTIVDHLGIASLGSAGQTRAVQAGATTRWDLPVSVVPGASITIQAFDDANANGAWDDGESAVTGANFCATQSPGNEVPPPAPQGDVYPTCATTDQNGNATITPLLGGTYYVESTGTYPDVILAGAVAPHLVHVGTGETAAIAFALDVLSPADQVIQPGAGQPVPLGTCYSDPAWVQPPFDEERYNSLYLSYVPEDLVRKVYSHGVYPGASYSEFDIWANMAAPSWGDTVPTDCATIGLPTFILVGYEPLDMTESGNVMQIRVRQAPAGLYGISVPVRGPTWQDYYLFVTDDYSPIVRCTSYTNCQWNDGTSAVQPHDCADCGYAVVGGSIP